MTDYNLFPHVPFYSYIHDKDESRLGHIKYAGYCLENEYSPVKSQFNALTVAPPITLASTFLLRNRADIKDYITDHLYEKIDIMMWRLLLHSMLDGDNHLLSLNRADIIYCNSRSYKDIVGLYTDSAIYKYNDITFVLNTNLDNKGFINEEILWKNHHQDLNIAINKRMLRANIFCYSHLQQETEPQDNGDSLMSGFISVGGLIADTPSKTFIHTADIIHLLKV